MNGLDAATNTSQTVKRLVEEMLRFPVDIVELRPQLWSATWADFPQLGQAEAADAQSALEALIEQTFDKVSDLVFNGEHPIPSEANGRPVVSFGEPGTLVTPHLARLLSVTRSGTYMATFSWTNDFTYVE